MSKAQFGARSETLVQFAQARSVAVSLSGMVASESPLASQAAAVVLGRGGNAVDAAIAANAVLGVVAPHSCGLGGDLFAMVYEASSGRYYGLNASGWSPQGLTPELLKKNNFDAMPRNGIHSVSVPGSVKGWQRLLERFGSFTLEQLLEPAILLAEKGFPVAERSALRWQNSVDELIDDARETFLPGGRAPHFGEVFRNVELAHSLRLLAQHGADAFYKGEIAERLIAFSQLYGGTLTAEDLAEFDTEWVEPISTTYRGWTLRELPPNGAGIAALTMMNILENFPVGEYGAGSADALHILIEAKKLAYADMLRYVCDPTRNDVPVERILSKEYARERAGLISSDGVMDAPVPGQHFDRRGDTVYLSVTDRAGNIVSLIQSIFMDFGSGLAAKGTGFALQNRAHLFSVDPAHPNVVAGRKRPLHTILPGFLTKDSTRIAFGIQGGWNQSQAHAQFVSNVVDHGMNVQAAMEFPRFTKLSFERRDVQVEARIPAGVRESLQARGHEISVESAYSEWMGGGQAILHDAITGVSQGASDPRKDGCAVPEPIPVL